MPSQLLEPLRREGLALNPSGPIQRLLPRDPLPQRDDLIFKKHIGCFFNLGKFYGIV